MKMIDLLEIIQDENRSEDFLRSRGILKTFAHCIKCNHTKLGMIRGDRWKCYSCKAEWTRRKDSILSLVRMQYSEFILCMKFFELELTAEETSTQLKLNYKTVVQLNREFRIIITGGYKNHQPEEKIILGQKIEQLGIYFIDEKFYFDFGGDNKNNIALLKLQRNKIADSAVILDVSIQIIQTTEIKSLFSLPSVFQKFLRYTKEKLFKFRGTERYHLQLYLKEIEYRFNNMGVDIYDSLGELISNNF